MSTPTTETSLAFIALDIGSKYMQELGQIRVWTGPTVPTADPENYLEALKGFLGKQGLILDHCGSKIPLTAWIPRNYQENTLISIILFCICFILFTWCCCCFYCFLSFILTFYFILLYVFLFLFNFFYFLFCWFLCVCVFPVFPANITDKNTDKNSQQNTSKLNSVTH